MNRLLQVTARREDREPFAVRFAIRVNVSLGWAGPGLVSGLLLWLSFPPVTWSWLAWFALLPLLTLLRVPWRSRPIYRAAWAGGLVFGLLAVQWIRYADDSGLTGYYGWWALAAYMSLYFPAFVFVARLAVLRFRVPGILAVPLAWVGLEYLRSWLLTGFPWYFLGHSQVRSVRLIQIADFSGAYGVSFVVALVNGWLTDVLPLPLFRPNAVDRRLTRDQTWRLALAVVAILAALSYGEFRLSHSTTQPGPRVALIQTNVPQKVKVDDSQVALIKKQYQELLNTTAPARPELVIWPETSFLRPLLSIASDVSDEDLRRRYSGAEIDPSEVREYARKAPLELISAAQAAGAPMLVGVNVEQIDRQSSRLYNSAVIVTPDGVISRPYHKIHLVPWGEYLPLRDWMPWLHIFTPHASGNYGLTSGREAVRLRCNAYSLGVLICFEDTVPWRAREYVRTDPVDILVNISNDGWFHGSSQLDEHLAISVFRAIECRRPLVRAVNTGVSAIIDSSGRIVAVAGSKSGQRKMSAEVVVGEVPLDHRESLYARTGDWLGLTSFLATLLVVMIGFASAVTRRLAARRTHAKC